MDQLKAMKVFVRVVDAGGFAKAARALDMAPPVVTRMVAELENHLGARLLNRTTRSLSLTEVGEQYLDKVRTVLADLADADTSASEGTLLARGHLRVLCPPAVAVHQLAKHLPRFQSQYPQVTLEISSPGAVESVDESYDLTIFSSIEAPDGDFIARRLARSEVVVCASPEYLDRRGRPQHPRELVDHEAVIPPISVLHRGLTFYSGPLMPTKAGAGADSAFTYQIPKTTRPALATTHIDTMYAAALAGLGIAGLPSYVIEDALLEHALERVLPEWRLFEVTLWAGMPSRRFLPARTRAFLDFLLEIFGGEDKDPWLAAAGCATAVG